MATPVCPASMCPLFAADGSPWTGEKNATCIGEPCGWFDVSRRRCVGSDAAMEQVAELTIGRRPMVIGSNYSVRQAKATAYDCPRADECQWQQQSEGLCPPRSALAKGLDPRACAW
jgi:hypothetical protein